MLKYLIEMACDGFGRQTENEKTTYRKVQEGNMALYIGTNYHPHDWEQERWKKDIYLMKEAGFNMVRLGHLCWDSFEPEDGKYTFEWFDQVMDLFAQAGIQVFLDISVRPAPVWVHRICPGCGISGKSGNAQSSLRRYMEDVSDPEYQYYALRFAETLVKRYRNHPALFAFGLCNEIGDGYLSYSESARKRFIHWLQNKYVSVDALNQAWACRRWSRKLNSFNDVFFPENEIGRGAPEVWLDMKRFWSDETGEFIVRLGKMVTEFAPGKLHSSNHYAEKNTFGFDYLKFCDDFVDYPGMGIYVPYKFGDASHYIFSVYMQRLAETGKPMWCLEFQTGSNGTAFGPYGAVRRYVMLCLLHRAQMILGWTFRSMLCGEEQYLFGMLSHDGMPTQNYREYQQIAQDIKKLEPYAFPYLPSPDIAVAWNYDSFWCNQYNKGHYRTPYEGAMTEIAKTFFNNNRDYNIVDLRNLKGDYKLLIIPQHIVMEPDAARTVREFVAAGGTVIMTAYSAKTDEHNHVFGTPQPGLLEDVFGIRVAGHLRTDVAWNFEPDAAVWTGDSTTRESLCIHSKEDNFEIESDYYEILELRTAESIAEFEGKNLCAVSVNTYGKGYAYYTAVETNAELLTWLIEKITDRFGLKRGIKAPEGIQARKLADRQFFYVNTTDKEKQIYLEAAGTGVLSEKRYEEILTLKPYDAELIIADE